jgi:DNA end-binding protein Ku
MAANKSYLVQPGKGGEKTYALMSRAMVRTGKVAIVQFAIGQRKHLACIYPDRDGYLILEQLMWEQDIRKPDFDAPAADVSEAELELACGLIKQMSGDYDHAEQVDESMDRLQGIITARLEGKKPTEGNTPAVNGAEVINDLMSVLRASVADIKKARTEKKVAV